LNADALVLDFIQNLHNGHSAESVSQSFQALIEALGFTHFYLGSEARAFEQHDGWSIAFHSGLENMPAITVGCDTPDAAISGDIQIALHLAAIYCGLKLAELDSRPPPAYDVLSARERECLGWVASGKTDPVISRILGVSKQTVHKHVSNALRKLNATTRAQAVAVAMTTRRLLL
jgi:DNA-binding CsgD family transcriptional regulator